MSGSVSEPGYLDTSLAAFLGLVSAADPAPAAGSVAAVAVALGAGLCAMVARLSADRMTQTPALVERSEHLRDLAARLVQEDAVCYGRVLDAERLVRGLEANERLGEIAAALSSAAEVPLQVAELGAAVAATAAELAEHGNPRLLGDAVTAALLAEAGARAAAVLVEINLGKMGDDDRIARAEHAVAETAGSARRARLRLEA